MTDSVDPSQVKVSPPGYDQGDQMSYPGQQPPYSPPQQVAYTTQPQPYGAQAVPMQTQMQPVIHQQPSVTNTTVVVNQPQTVVVAPKDWNSGICGCFEDCASCAVGFFCPQILGCMVASQLNEDCCCCVGLHGALAMRVRVRTLYNIQGSLCNDMCTTICCHACVLCQLRRELHAHGVH